MKRLFLPLLLAWVALAPAVASSCAADCAAGMAATAVATERVAESGPAMPDCHGVSDANQNPTEQQTDDAGMISACVFAATATMSTPSVSSASISIDTRHIPAPQLAPASTLLPPPDKPPQR